MLVKPPVLVVKATFSPTRSYKDPRLSRESAEGQLLFAPPTRDSWDLWAGGSSTMMALAALLLSVALADIPLATFDGATAFEFQGLRDRSKSGWSNFHLDSQQHVGIFAGEVVDDGLQQSGSIKAVASGTFPDASAGSSSGAAVVLLVRSRTPEQATSVDLFLKCLGLEERKPALVNPDAPFNANNEALDTPP
eukprot:s2882_g2.t1